mmetsp:Transcript_29747/g.62582  ORF Transcript_29747/g.62582 Transcript_29747/m.62582 type:complete len:341 (+) Transcript_29747:79-1101(+)
MPSKSKPLSAYNLFFQYNRIKLLESTEGKVVAPPDSEPSFPAGLENTERDSPLLSAPEEDVRRHRIQVIEHTLDSSPYSSKEKRNKKSSQGSMTFLEMSNYMSKKWNDADETTKSIFQELSSDRKAKAQKIEFDLYRKSAQKFALNTKPSVSANMATSSSMPILSRRIVSLDTIGSSSRLTPSASQSSSSGMANANWDEPTSVMNSNLTPMTTFLPQPFKKVSSVGLKPINFVGSLSDNRGTYQLMTKNFSSSSIKSIKPMRQVASTSNVQTSAFKLKRDSMNLSNFDWEQPLTAPYLNRGGDIVANEFLERPISPIGGNECMDNSELRNWLSSLDWNRI